PRAATVGVVLEPSVPYPADTEIIANVVTSPHHLGATMVTSRTHRMTELFGRLAPGASLDTARTELTAVHAAIMREHPEAYSARAGVQLSVKKLRDQIASPARTILLVLLAAAAVVLRASVPRLPAPPAPAALGVARGSLWTTRGTTRRLRISAPTQLAFSFVLPAAAGMPLATLVTLQTATPGYRNMRQVIVFDV